MFTNINTNIQSSYIGFTAKTSRLKEVITIPKAILQAQINRGLSLVEICQLYGNKITPAQIIEQANRYGIELGNRVVSTATDKDLVGKIANGLNISDKTLSSYFK
jgi:hypothetical protein